MGAYGLLSVAAGGAVGSVLRYVMASAVQAVTGRAFPMGILSVNVLGSFAIGVLSVGLARSGAAPEWRLFWMVGVLGGFTTFSSFSMETWTLLADAAYGKALLNILLSVALCLGTTWLGILLAKQF